MPCNIVPRYDFWQNVKMTLPLIGCFLRFFVEQPGQSHFLFLQKGTLIFHFRKISYLLERFLEKVDFQFAPKITLAFLFEIHPWPPERNTTMRKQPQKGRCTKLMLDKCHSVCCLYDKVQVAAAKALNAEPAVYRFECNVPLNGIAANDVNLSSESYTSDFLIHYDDGHKAIREAVYRAHLSRPSVAERLDMSRCYWAQHGIEDWGLIIDKEGNKHESK